MTDFEESTILTPDSFLADSNLDCFSNALVAAIQMTKTEPGITPRIYQMQTPRGAHAYLVSGGAVLNAGVTWPTAYYPDYSLEQLQKDGTDVTQKVLRGTLSFEEDKQNYQRLIKSRFGAEGLGLARMLYNRLEANDANQGGPGF